MTGVQTCALPIYSDRKFHNVREILDFLNPDAANQTKVNTILKRISNSVFKRNNPCNLTHPQFIDRFTGLNLIDKILK